MSENDFQLDYEFPVSAAKLYDQFATQAGIRNWWTVLCEMEDREGGRASFRFPEADFFADVRITALRPNRLVEWEVLDSKHPDQSGFADLKDWVGTQIRFEIAEAGDQRSRLQFTHVGLRPLECLESCSSGWRFYLGDSLRQYLETGTGKPFPTAKQKG